MRIRRYPSRVWTPDGPSIQVDGRNRPVRKFRRRMLHRAAFSLFVGILLVSCDVRVRESTPSHGPYLDSIVNHQITEKKIPGIAIGIVKDGEIVLAEGYGHADLENETPADANTIYQLGSVTKIFTGHLLAMLISRGDMHLSDTLADFFPSTVDFRNRRPGRP